MNCEHCGLTLKACSTVEWLATATGTCLQHTIRTTHKNCQYYDTQKEWMEQRNLFDRSIPLKGLRNHIPLAMSMEWDSPYLAHEKLKKTILKSKEATWIRGR